MAITINGYCWEWGGHKLRSHVQDHSLILRHEDGIYNCHLLIQQTISPYCHEMFYCYVGLLESGIYQYPIARTFWLVSSNVTIIFGKEKKKRKNKPRLSSLINMTFFIFFKRKIQEFFLRFTLKMAYNIMF